jgi:hypothetical protein
MVYTAVSCNQNIKKSFRNRNTHTNVMGVYGILLLCWYTCNQSYIEQFFNLHISTLHPSAIKKNFFHVEDFFFFTSWRGHHKYTYKLYVY